MDSTTGGPDLADLKTRQRHAWASGDYAVIGTTLQLTGESLCESIDVAAGERVLDVAAGNGNAALAAARRGAEVMATDYVGALLARARTRAQAEGLVIDTREADAEDLPFPDATFDVVLSTFGVMFTPHHARAAAELVRVCRPGGRIGLASWTPTSFVGQMFQIVSRYLPVSGGVRSPLEWGTEDRLVQLIGAACPRIEATRRQFVFRYRSAEHWLEAFRTYYGPVHKAFDALDRDGRDALARDLLAVARANSTRTEAFRAPSDYLEVVARKAG